MYPPLASRIYRTCICTAAAAVYMRVLTIDARYMLHRLFSLCLSVCLFGWWTQKKPTNTIPRVLHLFSSSLHSLLLLLPHQSKWDALFVIKRKETITESWVIKEKSCLSSWCSSWCHRKRSTRWYPLFCSDDDDGKYPPFLPSVLLAIPQQTTTETAAFSSSRWKKTSKAKWNNWPFKRKLCSKLSPLTD